MSNSEYVRNLLLTCPYIEASPLEMHINFIGNNPLQYSIDPEPTQQIIKKYLGGDTIRRFSFALSSRCETISDQDRAQNNDNYEKLSLWLEDITRKRRLPAMEIGKRPLRIEATGSVYLMERAEDNDSAIYMMQIELQYIKKVR